MNEEVKNASAKRRTHLFAHNATLTRTLVSIAYLQHQINQIHIKIQTQLSMNYEISNNHNVYGRNTATFKNYVNMQVMLINLKRHVSDKQVKSR